ncbi:MAG: imidazolonepropionase [Burkholderiales bacterium]|jgi:imidazolonepropionase|nr:imidazolonepropionase [Burkholderiales bacterium]
MWDAVWINARLATLQGGRYSAHERGAIAARDGHIAWVGPRSALPGEPSRLAREVHDCGGRWITPGLVDCHTHLVYAGDRAGEFEMRLEGATYEEIARAGGGIVATVEATRDASDTTLAATAAKRLRRLVEEGVTTVEVKSGYGLDVATETKLLRVARLLGATADIEVKTTLLGAHALPSEYRDRREAYLDLVCEAMLPAVAQAKLADAVDAFCEHIAFTPDETARVFARAQALGLPVKLHADQLSDTGGAALAARFRALSADHLEYTSEEGVRAMAAAGTVAVLLPGAFYFLRETQRPPIAAFRRYGVPMAIATDLNPGSSPLESILLAMNMACTLFRLTPEEALAGVTANGARALGLAATHGTLEAGKVADLAVWDVETPAELAYRMGANPLAQRVFRGRADRALS